MEFHSPHSVNIRKQEISKHLSKHSGEYRDIKDVTHAQEKDNHMYLQDSN